MLSLLLNPVFQQVLIGVGGAAVGWWMKHRSTPTPTLAHVVPAPHVAAVSAAVASPTIMGILSTLLANPTLRNAVGLLFDRFAATQQVAAHDTLQSLAAPVPLVVAAPLVAAAPLVVAPTK